MVFTPILLGSGLAGYNGLITTEDQQKEALRSDERVARNIAYFEENIGSVRSVDDLLGDRRLLEVAMVAYGLEEEIDNTAFVRRVLEEGTLSEGAFSNRLTDARWGEIASAFGFDDPNARFEVSGFRAAVELKFRPTEPPRERLSADDLAYMRANIGALSSTSDLLADSRLLDITLKSFGLERGYYTDAHFEQLLSEGTGVGDEYAYTLGDSKWIDFAAAFESLDPSRTVLSYNRFALDVERELSRRNIGVNAGGASDPTDGVINQADIDYLRAMSNTLSSGADLVDDPQLKEIALIAYGLRGTTVTDAELIAILDGGVSDPAAPANQQSDTAFQQLAGSFQSVLTGGSANMVPSFQIETEVALAQRDLEPNLFETLETVPEVDAADLAYFSRNADAATDVDALLADRRLLDVALAAFGLEDSGASDSFIRDILEADLSDPNAFVNVISDTRWRDLAEAFQPRSASDGVNPAIWQYEIERLLIENGAPEEDLFYLRSNFRVIDDNLDFVLDPRLLDITLSAFGLEQNRFSSTFALNAIISDPRNPTSFVNTLGDDRWTAVNALLGDFGGGAAGRDSFVKDTVERYVTQSFEVAVGEQDQDLRIALNFRRQIDEIATNPNVSEIGWLEILGDEPLRRVMDAAFGLPQEFTQLELEAQVPIYEARSLAIFGGSDPSVFQSEETVANAIERFLLQSAISANTATGAGNAALTLMSQTAAAARSVNISV